MLVTPGLLPKMGKVEIVGASSIPEKWSDHAALRVSVQAVTPPEPHAAVPESSKRMKRFDTRSQPTIASMFARKATSKAQKQQNPLPAAEGDETSLRQRKSVKEKSGK